MSETPKISNEEKRKIFWSELKKIAINCIKYGPIMSAFVTGLLYLSVPYLDGYVKKLSNEVANSKITNMKVKFARAMNVDTSQVHVELGFVVREQHTAKLMFDSLQKYKSYIDAVMDLVPEGVYWKDGKKPYWFTGRYEDGSFQKYPIYWKYMEGDRYRYWMNEQSEPTYIYSPKF